MSIPTREKAWEILSKYVDDASLLTHSKAVEGTMRFFAKETGEDAEYWGVVGLLHDVDYQKWPMEHCVKCREILKDEGVSEAIIRSISSHGSEIVQTDIIPTLPMEKVLFAVDELTGIIHAAALVRPSKSTLDMEVKSIKKKYKQKSFATGCSRVTIEKGAAMLGWDMDTLIGKTLEAMQATEKNEV